MVVAAGARSWPARPGREPSSWPPAACRRGRGGRRRAVVDVVVVDVGVDRGAVVVGAGASTVKLNVPSMTWPSLADGPPTLNAPPASGGSNFSTRVSRAGCGDRRRRADLTVGIEHLEAVLDRADRPGEHERDLRHGGGDRLVCRRRRRLQFGVRVHRTPAPASVTRSRGPPGATTATAVAHRGRPTPRSSPTPREARVTHVAPGHRRIGRRTGGRVTGRLADRSHS